MAEIKPKAAKTATRIRLEDRWFAGTTNNSRGLFNVALPAAEARPRNQRQRYACVSNGDPRQVLECVTQLVKLKGQCITTSTRLDVSRRGGSAHGACRLAVGEAFRCMCREGAFFRLQTTNFVKSLERNAHWSLSSQH